MALTLVVAVVPVPPLACGNIPVTLAVRSIVPLAIFAFVTALLAIVVAKEPVPLPVTSPVNVIV